MQPASENSGSTDVSPAREHREPRRAPQAQLGIDTWREGNMGWDEMERTVRGIPSPFAVLPEVEHDLLHSHSSREEYRSSRRELNKLAKKKKKTAITETKESASSEKKSHDVTRHGGSRL